MSRYFEIHITNGTPICDTYTIYHTSAVPGNEVTLYPSNTPATGITYSQLTSSPPLVVTVPDNATIILLKDTCGNCTPYTDPTPARHFEGAVIEANTLNLLSQNSACDGYGNSCLVSGNGLTFCTSTKFYSNDFLSIQYYPTYLIYGGNKMLVTGTIGSFEVNVINSCTACDDRPTIFNGTVSTLKSNTFTAQASFSPYFGAYGYEYAWYYGSKFQTNPVSLNFDNVIFDTSYFSYDNNGGYNILKIIGSQTRDVVIEYNMIFDISGMVASGDYSWQNYWRVKSFFYMAELYKVSSTSTNYILTTDIIGDFLAVENNNNPTTVRVKFSFAKTLNTNTLRNAYRFTLSPSYRSVTWTSLDPAPNYKYSFPYQTPPTFANGVPIGTNYGPWGPPYCYNCPSYPIENPKYWDNWGTLKVLPGSHVKIYDYTQYTN